MGAVTDRRRTDTDGELEYFGFQLRVKSPHLAALLAGDDDRVCVVRAGEEAAEAATQPAGDAGAARDDPCEAEGDVVVRLRCRQTAP